MKSKRPMKLVKGAWLFVLRQKLRSLECEEQIVHTEIPYEINRANLVRKSIGSVSITRWRGIAEVRDESDRDGLRIAIELKKTEHGLVLNYLFKYATLPQSVQLQHGGD